MRDQLQHDLLHRSGKLQRRAIHAALLSGLLLGLTGCRESAVPIEQAEQQWTPNPTASEDLPVRPVQRSLQKLDSDIELVSAESAGSDRPVKGSAQWLMMEIAHLRNAPADIVRQPVPGKAGEYQQIRLTSEQAAAEQIRRQKKVIELSLQAISKTHEAPEDSQLFSGAVHALSDARLQLALAGDHEQGQLLDENAEALFTRDPTSFAAVDAASHVVELTRALADRHAQEDPKWARAYARQTRLFAERFPQETSRAAVNVIAAGRLCERLNLDEEAESCLAVIHRIAPNSPYSEQVSGSLRRLRLPGQPLKEFGGSTFDGSFTSIDRYRGKAVIVAFWASNSEAFRRDLPGIQAFLVKSEGRVTALGVNLDRDELAVEKFIRENEIDWKSIFYSDPEKRGSRNMVARHYGVINVPEYWLVDAQGTVRSIHLDVSQLDQQVSAVLAAQ